MRKPKKLPPEELTPFVHELRRSEPFRPLPVIDWSDLFQNEAPVEIEVGFGKGTYLVHAATRTPERNFYGIEIEAKYHFYVASRLARRRLTNARVCCGDAKAILTQCVADASVEVVHVYFPDPWWKRRHWKRRLFTQDFAESCARVIRPGGELSIATDVEEYFGTMTGIISGMSEFEELPRTELHPEVQTNFEKKALERGGAVYRTRYRRRG